MSKGLGLLILGGLAVIGGAVFAALMIRNRFAGDRIDFDDFDDYDFADDEEFERFLEKEATDADLADEDAQ
ncbi:MAG: hypothetical protein FWD48_07150 [Oscillospiraceae bacterium]|nr:hypothetical protein [Oscillospiraceae bacterium]